MFRKLILLVFLLALTLPVMGVQAQGTPDLTGLQRYMPDSIFAYIGVRTDEAYVETLDGVIGLIGETVGMPGMSLEALISSTVPPNSPVGYAELRTWLGDKIAVGMSLSSYYRSNPQYLYFYGSTAAIDRLEPSLLIAEVRDSQVARDFFTATSPSYFTQRTEGDFLFFEEEWDNPSRTIIAIGPDLLFVGSEFAVMPALEMMEGEILGLNETLAQLPAENYNLVFYLAADQYQAYLAPLMELEEVTYPEDIQAGIDNLNGLGRLAVGLTLLDGRTFTIDGVRVGLENSPALPVSGAVNPAFAANVSSNTALLIHATNLFGTATDTLALAAGSPEVLPFLDQQLSQALGLSLNDLGWLSGDVAISLGLGGNVASATGVMDLLSEVPVSFGIMADASSDRASAVKVVDVIEQLLGQASASGDLPPFEVVRAGDLLTLTLSGVNLGLPLDIVLNAGLLPGDIFFVGTPSAADTSAGSLADSASLANAAGVLLPNPSSVLFVDVDALVPLFGIVSLPEVAQNVNSSDASTLGILASVVGLFESATVSTTSEGDNTWFRATMSLK